MKCPPVTLALVAIMLLWPGCVALASPQAERECLLAQLEAAPDDRTVGDLRSACESEPQPGEASAEDTSVSSRASVVDVRREEDFDVRTRQFAISTYRANYFIYTYNSDPNEDPYQVEPSDFLDNGETKFQVSFKMPVATELFGGNTDLMFAFTSVAWWQMLNDDISNPFRETNYEPELFFQNYSEFDLFGLKFTGWELGLNHQSNGQSIPTSRGWDRMFGSTSIELTDDLVLGLRAWYVYHSQEDNNPDIEKYMGYGDIGMGWVPNRNTFTLMYRPASEGGAVQATWSYPISKYLRLYAHYLIVYGESLFDYDVRT